MLAAGRSCPTWLARRARAVDPAWPSRSTGGRLARTPVPRSWVRLAMARSPASVSAAAADSSGPTAAAARCHAACVSSWSSTAASAAWASRICSGPTTVATAGRKRGWTSAIFPVASRTMPARSAGPRSSRDAPRKTRAALIGPAGSSSEAATTESAASVELGRPRIRRASASVRRPPGASTGGSGDRPARCRVVQASHALLESEWVAGGLDPASAQDVFSHRRRG